MRWFDGEPFERIVALLTALVVVATAGVAYLQGQADARGNVAERVAQQVALEGMGLRARGEMLLAFEQQDALRVWNHYTFLGFNAEDVGDDALFEAYAAAQAQVEGLSVLLQPPYFDAETAEIDLASHEADLLIEEAALFGARFENLSNLDDAWEAKAQNYVAQLTVLAVGLFLYSLSNTIPGRIRWGFVGLATVLTVGTLAATVQTARAAVPFLPEAVLQQYASAEALAYREAYDDALATYNVVLEAAPDYVRALIGRAQVHDDLGNLDAAIADYGRVVALGGATPQVLSDMGYVHYQNGDFAIARDLALDRTAQPWADPLDFFDVGLTRLALGDEAGARDAYAQGIALAADVVLTAKAQGEAAPTAMWDALELGTIDIEAMTTCAVDAVCFGALEAEMFANAALDEAKQLNIWLREALVSLQFDAMPPVYPAGRELMALTVSAVAGGVPQTTLPQDTARFALNMGAVDLTGRETVVVKVFVDGFEDPTLRKVIPAVEVQDTIMVGLGADSSFALLDGPYAVDLYVDNVMLGQALFEIAGAPLMADDEAIVAAVAFDAVDGWSAFVDHGGVFVAEAEAGDAVAYVLVEPDVTTADVVDVFSEIWDVEVAGDPMLYPFLGGEGFRFDYTFEEDEGIIFGEAVGVVVGRDAVYVMVEVLDETRMTGALLDAVLGGVRLDE